MATLVMIESWLQSTGRSLPPLIHGWGHGYVLMTRDPAIYRGDGGTPHPALRHADEVVVVDTNDAGAAADRAEALAADRHIDGVVTTCDYYLVAAATIARRLGLPGPDPAVMAAATRKDRVRDALARAGLTSPPNPAYAVATTWAEALAAAEAIGYPLVAKPVDLNAGTSVRRVERDAHLKDAVNDIAARHHNTRGQALQRLVLLEEVVTGTEVSVEAATVDGRTTIMGMTDKSVTGPPAFIESGHMFPAPLDGGARRAVEALVHDALAALGYTHGLSHTEVMITGDGPRIVEINPRQGGGYIFDLAHLVTGTNPLALLVDLALGRRGPIGTAITPAAGAAAPAGSAAVVFVMSPCEGHVQRVTGLDGLAADPHVLRWSLPTPVAAPAPADNEAYLGYVITLDLHGDGARARAEAAVGALRLCLADGRVVAPLGVPSGLVRGTGHADRSDRPGAC